MKYILLTLIIFSFLSCKAQSPIIPLGDYGTEITEGSYQKDVDNLLNPFEGTWKYENGNTSLTISLRKITMYYNGRDYRDDLIGDYRYVEDGVELANYLPEFNNTNDAKHTVKGNALIQKNWFPRCPECDDGEPRFVLSFLDPERKYLSSEIAVRQYTEDGVEKLKVWLYDAGSAVLPYEGAPESIRVPYGEYVLVKQ
ncbi:DUF6705 family protein [Winogradskyella sp. SYSU M77433]|uniref:DUF6705 family protein n=1 Tax=Winogradskyella sp. SYSU M77433 TaxID=3042722 RepID=UPI0024806A9F|nr:DUF6705 family protein [Winogradskyella sp. SYSU M77433]MDH7912125.1 hypothetical protein [Winogradskyella sp. SYSU M77433]